MRAITIATFVLAAVALVAPAQAEWLGWEPFASLRDQQGNQIVVVEWQQYRLSESPRKSKATWWITNNTAEELF